MADPLLDSVDAFDEQDVLPLAVVLVRRPSRSRWQSHSWTVTGVVAGEVAATLGRDRLCVHNAPEETRYLCGGLNLELHEDEGESYHHNLTTDAPAVFVISRADESGEPRPFLATVSYAEASAYLEGDAEVQPVPMPPEIYRWVEAYVVHNYVPQERKKRKRQDWFREDAREG